MVLARLAAASLPPRFALLILVALLGASGLGLALAGRAEAAWLFTAAALPVVLHVALGMVSALRGGRLGVDALALLAILAALALGEAAAAAIIALMVAGGEALEAWAEGRATAALTSLLARAPRLAARIEAGRLVEIPVAAIRPGDHLLVRHGEMLPADGQLLEGVATLDESVLTGEALPVTRAAGARLRSGAVNAGAPLTLVASDTAAASAYAAILRLTEAAAQSRAPLVRLADRWALAFILSSLTLAGLAWAVSEDPRRALAVLVVATPCPLILAAPVALMAGIGRAARRGIVVKGGAALERLARVSTVIFDKTGTLTPGRPRLVAVETAPGLGRADALRMAAALAEASIHPVAAALAAAAPPDRLKATRLREVPGGGLQGEVGGAALHLGSAGFLRAAGIATAPFGLSGALTEGAVAWLARDGQAVAAFLLADTLRPEAAAAVRRLRAQGIGRILVLSGDRAPAVAPVAAALRLDAALAERSPLEKLGIVEAESRAAPTAMVGDGVNDAPALAAASVGIAMGAEGTAAAAEAGDVVLLADRIDLVPEAIAIARRARRVALQAIGFGIGASVLAMAVAAAGHLPPLAGALVQEAIDVAAILFALTARRPGPGETLAAMPADSGLDARQAEHAGLRELAAALGAAAEAVDGSAAPLAGIAALSGRLTADVLPHQSAEEATLYPAAARRLGGPESMAALLRMHSEIVALAARLARLLPLAEVDPAGTAPDLRRTLFALEAILALHLTAEEEVLAALGPGA